MPKVNLNQSRLRIVGANGDIGIFKIGEGSLSWDNSRDLDIQKDETGIVGLRVAKQNPFTVNVEAQADAFAGPTDAADYLNGAPADSVDADKCAPFAVDLVIEAASVGGAGCLAAFAKTFSAVALDSFEFDASSALLKFSGKGKTMIA